MGPNTIRRHPPPRWISGTQSALAWNLLDLGAGGDSCSWCQCWWC